MTVRFSTRCPNSDSFGASRPAARVAAPRQEDPPEQA